MTPYEIGTVIIGVVMSLLGAWNGLLWGQIQGLNRRLEMLPETYARRDDVRDLEQKILNAIDNLGRKLDDVIARKE